MGDTIATNKKAFRDYAISEKWECGIELIGAEVKSIRNGGVNFKDSFVRIEQGQALLYNLFIQNYQQASYMNEPEDRVRRLLLHKKEIRKIEQKTKEKGLSVVPTKMYFNKRGYVKMEVGLGKGKKAFDKRETIKKRDISRDLGRMIKNKNR